MKIDEIEHEEEDILEDSEQSSDSFDDYWDGRWEYAFESLTERGTAFRRRAPTY